MNQVSLTHVILCDPCFIYILGDVPKYDLYYSLTKYMIYT
jgi:hypothetical protein